MLKDVTLGQYFPGTTAIHRLDPRTKLVLVIVYIVALFLAKNVVSYALVFVFLAAVVMISRIQLKVLLRSMKPLLFIIILTGLLNLFYGSGEPIAKFWIFKITKSGIQNAIFMVLRITMLLAGTFMLTYTTSPIALTDGLESLLSPLKKLHAPVHELSMMMCICSIFLRMEKTDENEENRAAIWEYLKEKNPELYKRVKNTALNWGTNIPTEAGRQFGLAAYHIAQKIFKFN